MMVEEPGRLKSRAERLAGRLRDAAPGRLAIGVREAETAVGGGALPLSGLSTWVVAVTPVGFSVSALEKGLRLGEPPVLVRIQNNQVLFDPRTLSPDGDELLPDLVVRAIPDP
jgi:L-seryl-tRNA(Ser) seleniumtransferase